jgi:hypothetical protein
MEVSTCVDNDGLALAEGGHAGQTEVARLLFQGENLNPLAVRPAAEEQAAVGTAKAE